jgi:FkbM family methyltransferase
MKNSNQKDFKITCLEIINHILSSHPTLHENVSELCSQISGKKSEFKNNIAKWFAINGDVTLRLEYNLTSESIVFDLGGYEGDFAYQINKKYNCNVYLFEPSKKFYNACVERFENNAKIKCFNFGYSNENGEHNLSDDANGSSIIKNSVENNLSEKIIVRDICELFQDFKISNIDLMKINIEGPEFLILDKLISQNNISNITNIQVQFHEFYPNSWKLRDDIRYKLTATHEEMWNFPFVWESWKIKNNL